MSDEMAISRAIDALKDPVAQAVAEAIVDRVAGLLGDHQLIAADTEAAHALQIAKLTDDQVRLEGQLESMKAQMGRLTHQIHELRSEIEALRDTREVGH